MSGVICDTVKAARVKGKIYKTCYDGGSDKMSISERQLRMSSLEMYVKRACMAVE